MHWRMSLCEISFDLGYKKCLFKKQADSLSYFRSLKETTVPVDAGISTYPLQSDYPDEAPNDPKSIDNFNDALAVTINITPSLISISLKEINLLQNCDKLRCTIRSCFGEGKRLPSAPIESKVLSRSIAGFEQFVISQSLFPGLQHLSHHDKMAGRPGGRSLYQFLPRNFFFSNMSLDCYHIARNCVSCEKNRVTLRLKGRDM